MKTIIAAFCDNAAAQQGAELLRSRFGSYSDSDQYRVNTLGFQDAGSDILSTLTTHDVPRDRAQAYAEIMRRGATVLSARVPDANARELADELDNLGSLDLDAAEKRWRSAGWDGFEMNAMPFDPNACQEERGALEGESQLRGDNVDRGRDLDVVEEEVQIGKREVPRGGVRVRTFIVERPVEETVQLHDENIDVQRERVDEPISARAADQAFTEGEFEVTARGEEAVVGKEARVVERVHVGKTDDTRTETIKETERRREVEVEALDEDRQAREDRPRTPRH